MRALRGVGPGDPSTSEGGVHCVVLAASAPVEACRHRAVTSCWCCADGFSKSAFLDAMSVVLATAAYLPEAQCFALLPIVHLLRRTGNDDGAMLDYNLDSGCVHMTTTRPHR